MDGWRAFTSVAVVVAAVGIVYLNSHTKDHVGSISSRNLVIGVISARDHFLQRDAIRRTWGSELSSIPNSELVFIVGEYECPVPPEDRVSPYSCEKWNISPSDAEDSNSKRFFDVNWLEVESHNDHECPSGIGFQVLHPILLESISVSADLLSRLGNFTVILQDAEEVLESVAVTAESCFAESKGNVHCDIKLPSPMLLPTEFEGELRVLHPETSQIDFCGPDFFLPHAQKKLSCDWMDSSVIRYKYLRSFNNALTKWSATSCPPISAIYSVADRDDLKQHIERESERLTEWYEHMDFVMKKIAIEQVLRQDVLVIPHLDVYSKLPEKILLFLKRLTTDFDFNYAMKVDDDTYLNISSLKTLLSSDNKKLPLRMWSRFHHHRSVPFLGKWADISYPSLTYPSFPSGAGYLMSGSLVRKLAQVSSYLTSHSGEDVSMGIWVTSVVEGASLIEMPCWLPRSECQESVLLSQLSPIDMMEMWKEQNS